MDLHRLQVWCVSAKCLGLSEAARTQVSLKQCETFSRLDRSKSQRVGIRPNLDYL